MAANLYQSIDDARQGNLALGGNDAPHDWLKQENLKDVPTPTLETMNRSREKLAKLLEEHGGVELKRDTAAQ